VENSIGIEMKEPAISRNIGHRSPITRCCQVFIVIFFTAAALSNCASRQTYYPPKGTAAAKPTEVAGGGFTGVYHTVEQGQTLWRISKTYGVDLETLQWVNDVEDVTDLRVGRVLFIPGVNRAQTVQPAMPEDDVPSLRMVDLIWPLRGRETSGYGPRSGSPHQGLDLAAPTGTLVLAAADGKVAYSGNGMRGYGRVVVIKHPNDLSTVYAHNSKLLVRMGDSVEQGQTVAKVGQTGRATGPHLHFEVRRRGVPEDPMKFLPKL
jgi:murein DD-endopeptidase MepM/ murein hydrolase activator NlpD